MFHLSFGGNLTTSRSRVSNRVKMPITTLFSTTRGWNIGDEFILTGIRSLFDDLDIHINPLIFNRHPDLWPSLYFNHGDFWLDTQSGRIPIDLGTVLNAVSCRADNSFRADQEIDFVDLCVFAGTPEWLGPPLEKLTAKLLISRTPVMYLGVGYGDYQANTANKLTETDSTLLRRAGLVTVRDKKAKAFLTSNGLACHLLPCPALFACRDEVQVEGLRRLAICLQRPHGAGPQTIAPETNAWLMSFAKLAANDYEVDFVLHNIDEFAAYLPDLSALGRVLYSYDPKDYQTFYRNADVTITSRVHGAGLCASMGIPAIYVGQSSRGETVSGFLSGTVDVNETSPEKMFLHIQQMDLKNWSRRIINHKKSSKEKYLNLLSDFFLNFNGLKTRVATQ